MKKSVEFSKEAITVIESGKKAVGQMYKDPATGKIVFEKFKQGHRQKDRTMMVHESGWLKESKTRIKFFSSVKNLCEYASTEKLCFTLYTLRTGKHLCIG